MGQSTTVIPTGGGGAKVQDSIPTNPQKGDFWVDTSETPAVTKWYDGTDFVPVIKITNQSEVTTENTLSENISSSGDPTLTPSFTPSDPFTDPEQYALGSLFVKVNRGDKYQITTDYTVKRNGTIIDSGQYPDDASGSNIETLGTYEFTSHTDTFDFEFSYTQSSSTSYDVGYEIEYNVGHIHTI